MIVAHERCHLCGHVANFMMDDEAVLLREAKCENCGASIRNSDTAGEFLNHMHELDSDLISVRKRLTDVRILNACSSGYIHEALKELPNYTCCEYFDEIASGEYQEGVLCVDLCDIPFPANTFDFVITEDVFEHIAGYEKAMEEILRVLKVGGCHIFTVPLHENKKTESRWGKQPVYHEDPVRPEDGTLVITDWGEDIKDIVEKYGYHVEVKNVHPFYKKEDVTDVDRNYKEYLKNAKNLQKYLRYNSVVIVAEKVSENINKRTTHIPPKTVEVVALNKKIRDKNDEIRALNDDNEIRGKHIIELDKDLHEAGKRIATLQAEDEKKNQHIQNLDKHVDEMGSRIRDLDQMNEQLTLQNSLLNGQNQELSRQNDKLSDKNQELSFRNGELSSYNQELSRRNDELSSHNQELSRRNDELSSHNQELSQWNNEINYKNNELDNLNRELSEKNQELIRHQDDLNLNLLNQSQQVERLKEQLTDLKQTVLNKEGHIELLLEAERKYEHEKTTHAYKFAKRIQRIGNAVLPINSRRRFFARVVFNVFRHPRLMFHVINPKRIKNYLKYIRLEGMDGVKKRYDEAVDMERMQMDPSSRLDLELEQIADPALAICKAAEDYDVLEFPIWTRPIVSIVIPVYNEFEYTYNCLKSILKNTGDVAYEVLIANDCSTDVTKDVEKIAKNVRLITTEENVRFLRNCNYAAHYTRGKYILFLNNDTQVQENWLKSLIDLIERDETIGMVGSKLVYPDGYLQEAGGIVWNDASAWNYGNRKSPEEPEYNYVKEVDYISGAAVMIRKDLWEEIGGFDEQFAPAYYEDTDLAFEVRKKGYKVLYQPLSVVVHFEGVSNGTDVESGLKHYQQVNFQKFYDKWKDILQKEHEPNGVNVFTAKDRSNHKKHMLVVDHYVPHHDQDAGGKCTYMYLKLFVKMGFQVTFIGDNFYKHEPYTTELNQMGIEVLYGNFYYNNWQQWLKENAHYFDYIYLQRPHISVKYMDLVLQYSDAKIFYFAHDLHHIREYREYEMTKDPDKLASSERWKKIEYELFEKADVGHVVGSYEQGIMQKVFPNKPIRNIPLYIYEKMMSDINKDFSERHDLLYVGGFGHPPNVDAVLWFAREVYPGILDRYPNMKWHVVGGKVPKEIKELESPNIIIEGFVSDEVLEKLYRICRLAVVPLRFGAGVKGKVVEAAYFQIPLITTSIGAEGLDTQDQSMLVEDDGVKMAEMICTIYEDYDRLKEMSDNGIKFIQKNFMLAEAERVIRLDVDL